MRISTLGLIAIAVGFTTVSLTNNITKADEASKKVFAADKGPDKLDIRNYPKEIQESYQVFATKCVKCHTLARPINTDMTNQGWKMYIKRMMNKPDSGISPTVGKTIYKFLKFRQAEKDAKRAN